MSHPRIAKGFSGRCALFGKFSYHNHPRRRGMIVIEGDWVSKNIVATDLPIIGRTRLHRKAVEPFRRMLKDVVSAGQQGLIDLDHYRHGGSFVPRKICWDPSRAPSPHAHGIAIDFDPKDSPYGQPNGPKMTALAPFAEKHGIAWGGRWRTKDGMHFEVGPDAMAGLEPPEPKDDDPRVIVAVDGEYVVIDSELREGRLWVKLRDLEVTGAGQIVDHIADQNKVYFFD